MKPLSDRIARQNSLLAPYAVPHEGLLGREYVEAPDATRSPFQRDRDRIIHATAFRRLKGKTQVFVTGDGDHYRTRLTHTLEVAQISRDIARTLGLNEDLSECIALAHDLGHPPFGHAGEQALDEWMRKHGERFEHNLQSHRIVTQLETHAAGFAGLNLNREVLEGLLKHVTPHDQPDLPEGAGHSLEAQLVNIADEIAYTSHDCDDGLREELFSIDLVRKTKLGSQAVEKRSVKGTSLRGALIDLLVTDLYAEAERRISEAAIKSADDVLHSKTPLIGFSVSMRNALDELRGFLWQHMYLHSMVESRVAEGKAMVRDLCEAFAKNPTEKMRTAMAETGCSLMTAVKDYVAGMTDRFAQTTLQELQR